MTQSGWDRAIQFFEGEDNVNDEIFSQLSGSLL